MSLMSLPESVTIVEVSPRDGLQNQQHAISLDHKINLVNQLADAGLKVIETGSFVSPKWVPQMADSAELFAAIRQQPGVRYTALVPNKQGLDTAIACGVKEIALFAAVTDEFSQKNLNCSVKESMQRFEALAQQAIDAGMQVRGYLSCVLGCPYAGSVDPQTVSDLSQQLLNAGCYEVSLGDTIGVGTAGSTQAMLDNMIQNNISMSNLALHCHDTYGQAIANILIGLQYGISTIDASVAGLGGCPYAKGATGNVATEDVVYLLDGLQIQHGINLSKLIDVGQHISKVARRPIQSRAAVAIINSLTE